MHNINGPLQVISMNLEILKMQRENERNCPKSIWDRIEQVSTSLDRVSQITEALSRRKEKEDHEITPLVLEDLIKNEIEFWHSDLFFKHNVSKEFEAPKIATVVTTNPGMLQEAVDACIGILMEVMKTLESQCVFKIAVEKKDAKYVSVTFSLASEGLPVEGNILDLKGSHDHDFFELCREVLKERSDALGIIVEALSTGIRLTIPCEHQA